MGDFQVGDFCYRNTKPNFSQVKKIPTVKLKIKTLAPFLSAQPIAIRLCDPNTESVVNYNEFFRHPITNVRVNALEFARNNGGFNVS